MGKKMKSHTLLWILWNVIKLIDLNFQKLCRYLSCSVFSIFDFISYLTQWSAWEGFEKEQHEVLASKALHCNIPMLIFLCHLSPSVNFVEHMVNHDRTSSIPLLPLACLVKGFVSHFLHVMLKLNSTFLI